MVNCCLCCSVKQGVICCMLGIVHILMLSTSVICVTGLSQLSDGLLIISAVCGI